eukprot:5989065-Prymnesium_polylepis.1
MAVRALAAPWSVFGTLLTGHCSLGSAGGRGDWRGGRGFHSSGYPLRFTQTTDKALRECSTTTSHGDWLVRSGYWYCTHDTTHTSRRAQAAARALSCTVQLAAEPHATVHTDTSQLHSEHRCQHRRRLDARAREDDDRPLRVGDLAARDQLVVGRGRLRARGLGVQPKLREVEGGLRHLVFGHAHSAAARRAHRLDALHLPDGHHDRCALGN